jgi:hypothetical protein
MMNPLPRKEDDLLKLWRLERELDEAKEIGAIDRADEIEFEIEELMNEIPADRPRKEGA